MEALSLEKMESLVGGSDYCTNLGTILFGGQFQGSLELYDMALAYYDRYCSQQ
ncbi:hypothetical protein MMU07_19525 [Aquiflexum sp. LQ15W]|uniref:hypothetical protein n=1 Tax=Cognataquiflexum nitidum TaxID=2922272 RepID=UPI001F146FEF|nr:hypothetical protein [Cognataquiflexum nitidum]MCH6201780.1 hypothetical protein [Cognataquiflexum nitidum]